MIFDRYFDNHHHNLLQISITSELDLYRGRILKESRLLIREKNAYILRGLDSYTRTFPSEILAAYNAKDFGLTAITAQNIDKSSGECSLR